MILKLQLEAKLVREPTKFSIDCFVHFNVKNATSVPITNVAYLPFTILKFKWMRSG